MSNPAPDSATAKLALLLLKELEPSQAWSAAELANIDMLDGIDLPECILKATIHGRDRLVRTIMERRGLVPIVLEVNPLDPFDQKLNGVAIEVDNDEFGLALESAAGFKSLLAMIAEFDMKGLIEPYSAYPLLLRGVGFNQRLVNRNRSTFSGVLPELMDGVLCQPELAIALDSESSGTSTPEAYKPMLCWASAQMVQKLPEGLAPFRPFQEVDGHGSMKMWKAGSGQSDNMVFDNIEVGVAATDGCSQAISCLFSTMAPESARLGFRDDDGRVLCETTADFLLAFQAQACTEDNLSTAMNFVANYCPVEIMAVQAAAVCRRDFGLMEKSYRFTEKKVSRMFLNFDPLFRALDHVHPLHERVKELMTRDQWLGLFKRADSHSPDSLVGLYRAFGIDNSAKNLALSFSDFEGLFKGGYRFADSTQAFEDFKKYSVQVGKKDKKAPKPVFLKFNPTLFTCLPPNSEHKDLHSFVREIYQNVLKTNLWPAPGDAPTDVTSALRMASRLTFGETKETKSMALEAYLTNAGFDACVAVAKTPNQWITLTQVFSSDELKPYLKTMPSKARGRMLEIGMGL